MNSVTLICFSVLLVICTIAGTEAHGSGSNSNSDSNSNEDSRCKLSSNTKKALKAQYGASGSKKNCPCGSLAGIRSRNGGGGNGIGGLWCKSCADGSSPRVDNTFCDTHKTDPACVALSQMSGCQYDTYTCCPPVVTTATTPATTVTVTVPQPEPTTTPDGSWR